MAAGLAPLRRHKLALFGAALFLTMVAISVFGPFLLPYDPLYVPPIEHLCAGSASLPPTTAARRSPPDIPWEPKRRPRAGPADGCGQRRADLAADRRWLVDLRRNLGTVVGGWPGTSADGSTPSSCGLWTCC